MLVFLRAVVRELRSIVVGNPARCQWAFEFSAFIVAVAVAERDAPPAFELIIGASEQRLGIVGGFEPRFKSIEEIESLSVVSVSGYTGQVEDHFAIVRKVLLLDVAK